MVTPNGCYLEHSTSLWLDSVLRRAGMRHEPQLLDLTGECRLAWRVARKGLRLSVEALYSQVASICRSGPSIQAVFQKDDEERL
jgi:hypothetical protein